MNFLGTTTNAIYVAGSPVGEPGGEGTTYRVDGQRALLLKIFRQPLDATTTRKLALTRDWPKPPANTALPIELLADPTTKRIVGYLQSFYANALPMSYLLDSSSRLKHQLPNHLAFRIMVCRLLVEAIQRIHERKLVVGDISAGNFLLGRDWFGRPSTIYVIDCNSFQVRTRTKQGNEVFPSGVATEEYTAPEVQQTDWATSLRSEYSDFFGFGVLAWKLIFEGSHPFALITPRDVDAPPLGERIATHFYPVAPVTPLPVGWKAPETNPPISVLPANIRDLFSRTFTASDPRDRPLAKDWLPALTTWANQLTPGLIATVGEKLIGLWPKSWRWTMSPLHRELAITGGTLAIGTSLLIVAGLLLALFSRSTPSANPSQWEAPKSKPPLVRRFDPELFPKETFAPFSNQQE